MEKNIGENIKKLRELKGITREHMAAQLDMSLSGYGKVERNEIDLTLSRINQIAQIIGVDVSQVLQFDVSQVLNVNNNKLVQGLSGKVENMYFNQDDHKDKYITMLEEEIKRLKAELKQKPTKR